MSKWIGQELSKVEIQQRLGRGGMADVYLGRHTTLNRPVAVKILHAHLSEDDTLLTRFKDEAQAVAILRHPNIVQVFDFDVVDDSPYIVMELIEGITMSDYLQTLHGGGNTLPLPTIARFIEALAKALDYAHQQGIIHRDIKPSNVLLHSHSGPIDPGAPLPDDVDPVLADFGVARMANVGGSRTATGTIIGTPAYMSPEQVRGESVDARSDIYSLGIMLYEMIAGRTPFESETASTASLLVKQMSATPPPLEIASHELQAVVDMALAKDREQRYQTAGELAAGLNVALDSAPSGAAGATQHSAPVTPEVTTPPTQHSAPVTPEVTTLATQHSAPVTPEVTPLPTHMEAPPATTRSSMLPLIIGGVVALVMIAGALAITGIFSPDEETVAPAQPADEQAVEPAVESLGEAESIDNSPTAQGTVLFSDATVTLQLTGLDAPPVGFIYEAWLTELETEPLSIGTGEATDGGLQLIFTDESGANLTSLYSGITLSLQPVGTAGSAISDDVVLQIELDPAALQRLRLLEDVSSQDSIKQALIIGLPAQAAQYQNHTTLAVDALNSGSLPGGKLHAEHTINIIEGRESENYADWNGDGRTENPGDDVGLAPYLLILADAAHATAVAPDTPDDLRQTAQDVATRATALSEMAFDASTLSRRLTAADTVEEAQALIIEITGLRDTIVVEAEALTEQAAALDFAIIIEFGG